MAFQCPEIETEIEIDIEIDIGCVNPAALRLRLTLSSETVLS